MFGLKIYQGLSWWSSGWDSVLSLPRAQVPFLVRELRTCKLCSLAKNKEQKSTSNVSDHQNSSIKRLLISTRR